MANAGHLGPYCGGQEMACEPGLPLGILAGVRYHESEFRLRRGDVMTLLSDGVVEAMNEAGELMGFERTREISMRSAAEIAEQVRGFGQQDDITVLTIAYAGAI
jgi:serine phosphatase RsbU (regulator of sigma subunit)